MCVSSKDWSKIVIELGYALRKAGVAIGYRGHVASRQAGIRRGKIHGQPPILNIRFADFVHHLPAGTATQLI